MTLLQVLHSRSFKCGVLILTWLIVGHATGYMSNTWAGDPGGDKTGVATDAQNAGGDAFIISEPDAKDPDYAKKKEAYDEFKEMADKEPLAVKLADFVGQNRIAVNLMWTLVAGFLGKAVGWYDQNEGAGFIAAIVGAFLILLIYRLVLRRKA